MRAVVALLLVAGIARADLRVPEPRCPVAPLRLMIRAPGRTPLPVVTATADGHVRLGMLGAEAKAKIDGRGCVIGDDGLWTALTSDGNVWTAHEIFAIRGGAIQLAAGRTMRIAADGTVETLDAQGHIEPPTYGGFFFEGYREGTSCAAKLLLVTWLSAMPSMAVVDGAKPLPPPKGVCAISK